MNFEEFNKYGSHFCNLNSEQYEELFVMEAISLLPNNKINQRALLILSQILVGNISGSMAEVKSMQKANREAVFTCWLDILKDPDELRAIGKLIVEDYVAP
jgi:hypothetical protein